MSTQRIYLWTVPAFLMGTAAVLFLTLRMMTPEMYWAREHPKEVEWAKARYDLMQKAATQLYFDDENKGITIVKPTTDSPSPTGTVVWPK